MSVSDEVGGSGETAKLIDGMQGLRKWEKVRSRRRSSLKRPIGTGNTEEGAFGKVMGSVWIW